MPNPNDGPPMNPMNMMKKMMDDNGPPMEMCMNMCQKMTKAIEHTNEMAAYATPELRGLFETWLSEVEQEALKSILENKSVTATALASELGISTDSAIFIIARLAKAGKIETSAQSNATEK